MNAEKLNKALAAVDDAIKSIDEAADYLVDLYSDDEVSVEENAVALGRRLDILAGAVGLIELYRD